MTLRPRATQQTQHARTAVQFSAVGDKPKMGSPEPLSLPNLLAATRVAIEALRPDVSVGIYVASSSAQKFLLQAHSDGYLSKNILGDRTAEPGSGLTGYVLSAKEPRIVDDVSKSSQYKMLRITTRSELCIPILAGREILGVINLESDELAAFSQRDVLTLTPLTKVIASGILYTRAHDTDARFHQLVEHMNEAVWMGDTHERTVYANKKFQTLVEYSLDEMIGLKSYVFWDNESAATVKRVNEEDRQHGKASTYEGNLKTKTGKLIPVLLSGAPLPDGGTVGIMTDLRKLRETEEQFKQLVEYMKEGVVMRDEAGKITYANPALSKWLSYAPEDLTGKQLEDLTHLTSEEVLNQLACATPAASFSQVEMNLKKRDGSLLPVLASCSSLPHGGTVVIMTDLTEVKDREHRLEELHAHDQLLASLTQYSADAIVGTDTSLRIISWNHAAETIFGFTAAEIVGTSLSQLIPQERTNESSVINARVREEGSVVAFETVRIGKHGELINVSLTETALRDAHGKLLGYSVIYRDITALKKRERELQNRFDKMQEAYKELGRQRRQVDYLVELIDVSVEHAPFNRVADFIASAAIMLTHADACILRLYDPDTRLLKLQATHGVGLDWHSKATIPYADSLVERTIRDGGLPFKITDLPSSPYYSTPGLARKYHFSSALIVPLLARDELVGSMSLYLGENQDASIFDDDFIPVFAKQAAITLALSLHAKKS